MVQGGGVPDEEEIKRPDGDDNSDEEADVYLMTRGKLVNGDELRRRSTLHYKARSSECGEDDITGAGRSKPRPDAAAAVAVATSGSDESCGMGWGGVNGDTGGIGETQLSIASQLQQRTALEHPSKTCLQPPYCQSCR